MARRGINPKTGKRYAWEEEQAAKHAETLETEYAPVRERIAERQRINASGANQQPPPGTAVAPVAPGTMPSGAVLPPR